MVVEKSDLLSFSFSPHPYLFFNQDGATMTFVGFNIAKNGDLLDPQAQKVLESGIMNRALMQGLERQGVDLCCKYNSWSRFVWLGYL